MSTTFWITCLIETENKLFNFVNKFSKIKKDRALFRQSTKKLTSVQFFFWSKKLSIVLFFFEFAFSGYTLHDVGQHYNAGHSGQKLNDNHNQPIYHFVSTCHNIVLRLLADIEAAAARIGWEDSWTQRISDRGELVGFYRNTCT